MMRRSRPKNISMPLYHSVHGHGTGCERFHIVAKYVIIQRGPGLILSLRFQGRSGVKTRATSNSAKSGT